MSDLLHHSAESLDPVERLAVAYAPRSARAGWEALLLFNRRLAETAKPGREQLMIQLRLSWWRDRLAEPASLWPKGEPLLARLTVWEPEAQALIAIVDGWEAKVVGEDGGVELGRAQVEAYVALARLLTAPDLAEVRHVATEMVSGQMGQGRVSGLSRPMRPLAIQHAAALRERRGGKATPLRDLAALVRVGLVGR